MVRCRRLRKPLGLSLYPRLRLTVKSVFGQVSVFALKETPGVLHSLGAFPKMPLEPFEALVNSITARLLTVAVEERVEMIPDQVEIFKGFTRGIQRLKDRIGVDSPGYRYANHFQFFYHEVEEPPRLLDIDGKEVSVNFVPGRGQLPVSSDIVTADQQTYN